MSAQAEGRAADCRRWAARSWRSRRCAARSEPPAAEAERLATRGPPSATTPLDRAGRDRSSPLLLVLAAVVRVRASPPCTSSTAATRSCSGSRLGGALALLAAALRDRRQGVVPQETAVEERPLLEDERGRGGASSDARAGGEGISRRRAARRRGRRRRRGRWAPRPSPLPPRSGRASATARTRRRGGAAAPRRRPRRGRCARRTSTLGSFVTALPEGADKRRARLAGRARARWRPATLQPARRRGAAWAPEGILAYSKICTHAGCAISLYRSRPTSRRQPRPGARVPVPLLDVRPGDGRPRSRSARPAARCRSCR